MHLTQASSYALHAVTYMASLKSNVPIASHKIAVEKGIPMRFLLKVLKPLVDARVLDSVKGPNGGYRLARAPGDITLLEILLAVEPGVITGKAPQPKADPIKFPGFSPTSSMPLFKKLDHICKESADLVRKHIEKVKLSDLLKK